MDINNKVVKLAENTFELLCEEMRFTVEAKRRIRGSPFKRGRLWWDDQQSIWRAELTFVS